MAKAQPKNVDEDDFDAARRSGSLARDLADSKRVPTEQEADFAHVKRPGEAPPSEPAKQEPPAAPQPVIAGTGWWYARLDCPTPLDHKELIIRADSAQAAEKAYFKDANNLSYHPEFRSSEHTFTLHEVAAPDPADARVWPTAKKPEPELATAGV